MNELQFTKCEYCVYRTDNYDLFKKLLGNRQVSKGRIAAIRESVEKRGWLRAPILVNENFEMIDGQGRFEVAKELSVPIDFIIQTGLTIDDCISMNIKQKNWGTYDFIECYSRLGYESYKILLKTMNEYERLKSSVIVCALTGKASPPKTVKTGDFYCTEQDYKEGKEYLDFLMSILDKYILRVPGNINNFQCAIVIILKNFDIDVSRLKMVIEKNYGNFTPTSTIEHALENLEKYYNKGLRNGHQNFVNDYKFKIKNRYQTDLFKARTQNYKCTIEED